MTITLSVTQGAVINRNANTLKSVITNAKQMQIVVQQPNVVVRVTAPLKKYVRVVIRSKVITVIRMMNVFLSIASVMNAEDMPWTCCPNNLCSL